MAAAVSIPRRRARPRTPRERLILVAQYAILIIFALICIVPMFFVLSSSLKNTREIALSTLGPPQTFRWENYAKAWNQGRFGRYFFNTVIYSVPIVAGSVGLA